MTVGCSCRQSLCAHSQSDRAALAQRLSPQSASAHLQLPRVLLWAGKASQRGLSVLKVCKQPFSPPDQEPRKPPGKMTIPDPALEETTSVATAEEVLPSDSETTTGTAAVGVASMQTHHVALWLLCPALFVAGCWLMLLTPQRFASLLPQPRQSWLLGGPSVKDTTAYLIKSIPKSLHSSWLLGKIAGQLQEARLGSTQENSLIAAAADILKLPQSLDRQQLLDLGTRLQEFDAHKGPAARLVGLFNFVNLMWGLAIMGLSVSVGPFLAVIFGPLMHFLLPLLRAAAAYVTHILQLLTPVYEVVAYAVCLYIIGAADRYAPDFAAFIAITGCALAVPAFAYSSKLHCFGHGNPATFASLGNVYMLLLLVPVALKYESGLLGFFAAAALFGAVGFSIIPSGLCWTVGFRSADTMLRAASTAAVVLTTLMGLRLSGLDPSILQPFQLGLAVFGSITLFLAGLIRTSLFYFTNRSNVNYRTYLAFNAAYVAVLAVTVLVGSVYQMRPLTNTGITFLVLWVAEKMVENLVQDYGWVAVFGSSLALWQLALFLRNNPEWLASLVRL